MTPNLDQERVERAAETLRRIEQSGKRLNDWQSLPKATKQKWRDKVSAAITAYLGDDGPVDAAAIWKQAEACVPTNWCDDLLTGPSASRVPLDCPAIERLLLGIIKRMRSRAATPTVNGKGE